MIGKKINRLISFSKNLSPDFVKHIENSNNLCLYKLGSHNIPKNIFFPNASTLTLINCSNVGIQNILYPNIFPNLNTVNYLSMATSCNSLQHRFTKNTKWVFPDKNYDYYNYMVKSGYGVKDTEILKRYITNKKIIDGKNGFDISFEFDINVPSYGIIDGEWWRSQFYEYLVKKQKLELYKDCLYPGENPLNNLDSSQEIEEMLIEKEIVAHALSNYNFEDMIDNK
jgi:hypothetical protein